LRLGILDLAQIHEQALTALEAPGNSGALSKRAKAFFSKAVPPMRRLDRAVPGKTMKWGIAWRKEAEAEFNRDGKHFAELLQKSHRLQDHLRLLTHKALSIQRADRMTVSRALRAQK